MGAHHAHVDNPRGSSCGVFHRDSTNAPLDIRQGNVGISHSAVSLRVVRIQKIETYIGRRQNIVADWVATRFVLYFFQRKI